MHWYSVPGFTSIECNEQGQIRSTVTKRLRKAQNKCSKTTAQRKRTWIDVRDPGEQRKKPYIARLVLSAKLGRTLESWEDACHKNGDCGDNSMDNLQVGCRLNNIIDDIELGRLKTSPEQIERAIARLEALKLGL